MTSDAAAHYNDAYFEWQRRIGEFGAILNLPKFQPHIRATDAVVDFGCGGGHLLAAITCTKRCGVEVNPSARAEAGRKGVSTVSRTSELPDEWADVIISSSALEHVEHPLAELRALYSKLKTGGKIVLSVPNETIGSAYTPGDINQHLYSWSPMTIGNLVTLAGYRVEDVKIWRGVWPPYYTALYRLLGPLGFRAIVQIYRLIRLALYPLKPIDIHAFIVVVARKL